MHRRHDFGIISLVTQYLTCLLAKWPTKIVTNIELNYVHITLNCTTLNFWLEQLHIFYKSQSKKYYTKLSFSSKSAFKFKQIFHQSLSLIISYFSIHLHALCLPLPPTFAPEPVENNVLHCSLLFLLRKNIGA